MLLRSSLSPPPPPPLPAISTRSHLSPILPLKSGEKYSKSKVNGRRLYICNSISQVHSYGTVDFEKKPPLKWSTLFRRVLFAHRERKPASDVLEEWDTLERRLTKWEACRIAKELRKHNHFFPALQIYEWMGAQGDRFYMKSADMAIQLDLIGKVRGVLYAEQLFSSLSESFKDKRTFCSLLNAYVRSKSKEKAESIFRLMHENNYVTDTLPYNVMMTLYLNIGEHENVEKLICEMRERNMNFDIYTYNIWISNMSAMENIDQMEEILGIMESDNVNPNWTTYTTLASMYTKNGMFDKAEKCLKEAEMRMTGRNRSPFHYFMNLYANIGKKDEVYRIWNWYQMSFPLPLNMGYKNMIIALLKLEDIEGVEKIYEEWLNCAGSFDPKISQVLMSWYCNNGFSNKAKQAVDQLVQRGGKPNSFTWEILVYGFAKERNVGEALYWLEKAVLCAISDENLKWRPKVGIIGGLLDLCKDMNETESRDRVVNLLKQGGWSEKEPLLGLIERHFDLVASA